VISLTHLGKLLAATEKFVKFRSEHTGPFILAYVAIRSYAEQISMEYKGIEYSVVQLTEGGGWRWEVRLGDGKHKSGVTPISRAAAIKLAEYEIDRVLKDTK
jgi:hypothetical protein